MTLSTSLRVVMSRALEVIRRPWRDARLREEVQTHLDLLTADYVAKGLSPAEARIAARRAFGGVDRLESEYRDQRGLPLMDALAQDLRFATRVLGRDRGFAMTAVFVLGIGIGVNNMFFTILNAHTIRGLPISHASRVIYISTIDDSGRDRGVSFPDFVDMRDAAHSVAALAAYTSAPAVVSGDGIAADRFDATFLSVNAFDLIGVHPVLGRGFAAADDRAASAPVVMLGESAWRSRYGGDPQILGRAILVDGTAATIVGVAPDRSGFPTSAAIWVPLRQSPGFSALQRDVRNLRVLGRLHDDVAVAKARAEIDTIVRRFPADPGTNRNVRARVVTVDEQFFGRLTDPAWLAFVAAGFLVVLISCANVANLMLAHSTGRAREFAIRTSLGATRRRILRQLLIEGVVLAAAGAVLGFGVSLAGVRVFRRAIPENALPYWMDYSVDARVVAALAIVSLFAVLVFALVPALQASKTDVNAVLKDGGRPAGGLRRSRRWTAAFLVAEFALAVVLLSQVVESFYAAGPPLPTDVALNTRQVITASLTLPAVSHATPERRIALYQELDRRLLAIPGVSSVSLANLLPLTGGPASSVRIATGARATAEAVGTVRTVVIAPGYFRTLGVALVRGRDFTDADGTPSNASAIVNERFAGKFFPEENPIGQQIAVAVGDGALFSDPVTIVGVAEDLRQRPIADAEPLVYMPYRMAPPATLALLVRSNVDPASLVPLLRGAVMAVDPDLPVYRIRTMAEVTRDADWNRRLSHTLVLFITFIAVALSTVGLYAVTAHGVSLRTQEIGVRMALGAQSRAVVLIVLRRVLVQLAIGFAAGIVCSIAWERMFGSADAQRTAIDPQPLGAIAATLLVAAVIACFVPARRATRLDPVAAIRGDQTSRTA